MYVDGQPSLTYFVLFHLPKTNLTSKVNLGISKVFLLPPNANDHYLSRNTGYVSMILKNAINYPHLYSGMI